MLQVNFLSRLDEQGEGSLGGEIEETCAHSFGLAASAFKLCVSMLKPECYRKCLHIRLSVCACACVCLRYTTEYQLPVIQPLGCLIVLRSKPPITSESPLLSIKTIKTTLHAGRIITEVGGVTYYIAGQVWMSVCIV